MVIQWSFSGHTIVKRLSCSGLLVGLNLLSSLICLGLAVDCVLMVFVL
jgi:hypothetical protein